MRALTLAFATAFATAALAQDAGLLLGLESREEGAVTVFASTKGVASFVREVGAGYWLWSDKGLAHVLPQGVTPEGASAIVVTLPNGEKRTIAAEEGRPETSYVVTYVSPFGFGLMQNMKSVNVVAGQGFGGDGVTRYPTVYRNLAWSNLDVAVEVGQAFDEQIVRRFHESAATPRGYGGAGSGVDSEASPTNWTLRRESGGWTLFGRLLPAVENNTGAGTDFEVEPVTDPRHGAGKPNGPKWVRIRSEYPDALDATTSPDGKLTVVVTPDTVFVHESGGTSLGRRLKQIRVQSDRVVMTQWLEGDDLAKASAAIAKL